MHFGVVKMSKNESVYYTANEPWRCSGGITPVFLGSGFRRGEVLESYTGHCIAGEGNHGIEGWVELQVGFRLANDGINSHHPWE